MPHANIIAATRTPQAKLLGSLSHLTAPALGAHALRAIDEAMGWDNSAIDQVIMGQVVSAGCGQAPARQAATAAGIPTSVGAVTINKVCGSGLYSVMLADMAIRAGQYRRVIAGVMESMSQAPHLLSGGRSGWKFGAGICWMHWRSMACAVQTLGWPWARSRNMLLVTSASLAKIKMLGLFAVTASHRRRARWRSGVRSLRYHLQQEASYRSCAR